MVSVNFSNFSFLLEIQPQKGGEAGEKDKAKAEEGANKKLMTKETQQFGGVTSGIYLRYFRATGGYLFVGFVFFSFAADTVSRTMSDVFLSSWSNEDSTDNKRALVKYLGVLGVSAIFVFIKTLMVAKGIFFPLFCRLFMLFYTLGGLNSAKSLHDEMLVRVFHAPMSFFDTTPVGRVLNRFSKDQNAIDEQLFMAVSLFSDNPIISLRWWRHLVITPTSCLCYWFSTLNSRGVV